MHTEHLNNLRIAQLLIGWFIAVATTSLLIFVLIATGLLDAENNSGGNWIAAAFAIGFYAGGVYVGYFTGLAPILHGIAIGLMSLLVWVVINAIVSMLWPDFGWTALSGPVTLNVILVQVIGAVLGARLGYRYAVPA
jgi:hypothetical protein